MTDAAAQTMAGTIPVADKDRLDLARLTAWMATNVDGFAGPLTYEKFAGGQSNPTYKLTSPSGTYVLRRKPFGKLLPSAHAVDREYRVIAGLYPTGFPVARPYGLCTDESVIGTMFYIMGFAGGRNLWDGTLPDYEPSERKAIYQAMGDTLAALHNTDYAAAGLESFGKPGNYFARQVERWTRQYRMSETEHMPEVERLIEWLPRTVPEQTRTSVVHGDYRIDNMILHATEPRVIAVLDWELSTLGDPLADFSYFLMSWVTQPEGRSGVMGIAGGDSGIPTMDEMVARYCAATGRDGLPDLDWYFAYNLFRLTGIIQGIKKRVIDGTASSAQAEKSAAGRVPAGGGELELRGEGRGVVNAPLPHAGGAGGGALPPQQSIRFGLAGSPPPAPPASGRGERMSQFDLTGRSVVITGSSRGIGKASAIACAEQGANVVISSRKQDACDVVAAEINTRFGDGRAVAVAANISDKAGLQHLVDESVRAFGHIDCLVCNAASNPYYGPAEGIADEQFRKIMDNNILSNHWLISMAAPAMRARGEGSIVIVSSIGGLRGSTIIGAYCISKAADMQIARNLAHEYGPSGVRVNCIAPGLIKTDFAKALWEDPQRIEESNKRVPLRRIGEPDEIAGAVVFLASRASTFMTGQTMVIDGGVTI